MVKENNVEQNQSDSKRIQGLDERSIPILSCCSAESLKRNYLKSLVAHKTMKIFKATCWHNLTQKIQS